MPLRRLFFWLHLSAGVLAGLIILVLSVTGVLLAYQRQVIARAERSLAASATDAAKPSVAPSRLLDAAQAHAGKTSPSAFTLRSDPHAPVTIAFGREKTLFVGRTTGVVLGEGALGVRNAFHLAEDVHRWMGFSGDARDEGKALTGAANLLFLFLVLSGFWIWIPRTWAAVRSVAWFRGGLRGKARDFNWHNVLGIWSFLPLVLIVFSGVVISYPWASKLVYRAFGSKPPEQQGGGAPGGGGREARARIDGQQLDRVLERARIEADRTVSQWKSINVRLPFPKKGPVPVNVDAGNGTRPDLRSQLMLDPRTADLVEHKTYAQQEAGQQARAWLRWIHTGEAGGVIGQTIAMLASAAAVVLVWTGLALSLRRLRGWMKRKEVLS
jgi:uncharacterized iron-regulated membrane protein